MEKEINSRGFGLLIAFMLPGLAGFYAISYFLPEARTALSKFSTVEANIGLFFLIVLASLAIGLLVTVIRWVIYEKVLLKNVVIPSGKFAKLTDAGKLASFEAAVDQHYRYHQFWGGMTVVMPLIYVGWFPFSSSIPLWNLNRGISLIAFVAIEIATGFAACDAYRKYVARATHILA